MKNILKITILTICLLAQTCFLTGSNTNTKNIDYIFIINTYADSNPWSNSFINPIIRMASQNNKIGIYAAHLKMLTLKSPNNLKAFEENILKELSFRTPKLVIFIGSASFILCDDIDQKWPGIPMLLCGEHDYTGPENLIAQSHALSPEQHIPISQLQNRFNLTLLHAPNYMKENLQLMQQLIPKMNKVIYIGDGTYTCQQNNHDLSKIMRTKHPEMEYEFISAESTSSDSLFTILSQQDPQTTGFLFSSWLRKEDYEGNAIMTTNSYRIIATSSVPLFSLRTIGVQEEGGIVGGYIYNEKKIITHLLNTIKEILDGKPARNIPIYRAENACPVFNYQSLLQRNLDPKRCPRGTIFYNDPPSFWEQYEYTIIGCASFIFLSLLAFQYHRVRVLEKMKRIQQNELATIGKYYNLINNMPILYLLEELEKDASGKIIGVKIVDVNRHLEERFCKKSDIIGKTGNEIFPKSMPQFLHFMNIAMTEKRSVTFSYYHKTVDTFYDIVVNLNGNEQYMDVFCIDSTELHHVQEQLRSINHKLSMALDIANIVPWKWDLQSHTILCDVNKPIELSTHHEEITEEQLSVPDNEYFAKIHKEDLPKVKEAYANLIAGRTQKVKEEYRILNHINGHKHIDWVEAQAGIESYDDQGNPQTLVGSSLVITERKKMEDDLISAKNRAEESNRLKSAFLANMSHEIRTPLNAIVGFSGILASIEEEKEKQEYVSIIENNNALLLQLISDILDLSKIEAGTMEFIYSDFELNKIMAELESSLRLKLPPNKNISLTFEPQLPVCYIHAEHNRLSQIIINLVTNAIKFTDAGSIRFGYEKRNKILYFYVSDTGCGIPKDKKEEIFGRFVKLNNFAQGTGLGLSICRTLVQHMGGEIGLDSAIGKGSTFWFTLPYVPATNVQQQEIKSEPIKIKKQKITILVAEDHDSNYRLIESILKKDYNLIHAWNGAEAVAMFKTYSPQLILMDINMPVMDGYEATKEIRKFSTRLPIIAITAFAYASDEQKVMESGFDAYMSKPINANQLKGQITSILKQHIMFM